MNKSIKRILVVMLFIIYVLIVMFLVFGADRIESSEYHYNLVPFGEIKRFIKYRDVVGYGNFLANVVGNFIVFIPFGFLLPAYSKYKYNSLLIIMLSLEFSFVIEIVQLYTKLGSFDVDDLMLNTTGGFFGYILYKIINCIRRWRFRNKNRNKRGIK